MGNRHVASFHCVVMAEHATRPPKSNWRIALEVISWLVLLAGILFVGQIALAIVQANRVTTDTLCSAAGAFVVLLVGSLLHSVAKEEDNA